MTNLEDEKAGYFKKGKGMVKELVARGCVVEISREFLERLCWEMVKELPWGSRIACGIDKYEIRALEDGSLKMFFTHPELPEVKEGENYPLFKRID